MRKVPGQQLTNVWPTMSEAQRFKLVKDIVNVEAKLLAANHLNYGSLYYRGDTSAPLAAMDSSLPETEVSKFVIGPIADRAFWMEGRHELNLDRGPCEFPGTVTASMAD